MDSYEAAAALAGVEVTHERLAQQVGQCPPWRHAAFGAVMALLVGSATVSMPVQLAGTALGMGLTAWIVMDDRRRYGVFINGYRRGATLPLTFALLLAVIALMFAALRAREGGWSPWSKAGIGVLAFAVATWASVVWQRVYMRELRKGRR